MKLKMPFFVTVCLIFLIVDADAMDGNGAIDIKKGELLTLQRCIEIALKRHPSIIASRSNKMAAESRVGQAISGYYPQIELNTGYNRLHTSRDTIDQYSNSIILRQNIYDFGRTRTSTRIQRFNVDSSEAEIENITIQIIFNVKQAYYNLIKAKRNRDVSAEIVRQFEEHLLQAKGFYEAGTRPRYDVTQAEVNLSNARVNLIRAENNVRLALAALNNAMGVTDSSEYDIEDDLFYNKYEVTFDDALSVALRSRPDLRSLISRRRAAEESLELARRNYYPTLSGSVTYGWSGSSFPLEREWNLGASLSFPVFSGFLTRYQVSEAEANLNAIKADEELLRQKIFLDLQQTYLNLREAEERIPATELAVRQATENLEIARGRYEAGVGSPIEVTDAEVSYANAKASYIQALTDYRIAIADLERAIGKKD